MKLTRRVLHNRARAADFRSPHSNQKLADTMLSLMRGNNAIGLAATQIGHSRRIFVMCISGRTRVCFNPEITESSTVFADYDEGCLSFPGDQCTITRPDWVRVRYQDSSGKVTEDTLVALEARCFQHELDHLDGITMWDRYKEQHAEQS
jgi:peptide deformylase